MSKSLFLCQKVYLNLLLIALAAINFESIKKQHKWNTERKIYLYAFVVWFADSEIA